MYQLAQKYFVTLLLRTTVFVYSQLLSRRTPVSGGSRGEAPGPRPLTFRPNEARRAEKTFCWVQAPPLSQGLDDRPPSLIWRSGSATAPTYKQYQKLRLLSSASLVLVTSASVLSSDHTNSKSTGVLDAAVNSNVASQNTAAVPSLSSLSMSSSKDFHSSTLAISSSPFEVLSAGMANKQTITPLTLVSSVLVTSSVLVSTSVVPSNALSRSDSSSVATMSSNLITEQGTSAVTSVSSVLLSSSTISASSLQQSHLTAVVVGTTLAIGKSAPETPSPSSMLLASSTVVSQQSGTLFSDHLIEIQRTLQSNLHVRPSLL